MEVLTLLCSRAPALLRSEEIIEALWPRDAAAGNGLHKSITELRRAFEDDPARPVYIETVRKRGYRLVAPISGTEMVVLAVLAGSGAAPGARARIAVEELATCIRVNIGRQTGISLFAMDRPESPTGIHPPRNQAFRRGATHALELQIVESTSG